MKFKHSFLPVFGFMKKMKSHTLILLLLSTSILSQGQLPSMEDKIEGLLIGSAIGDAAGLPVEFVNPPIRSIRTTTSEKVSEEALEELAVLYQLTSYPKEAEPFAQWEAYGPPGTITDDTRFKIIFFNTLKNYPGELTLQTFAQSVLDFRDELPEKYKDNYDEWIAEVADYHPLASMQIINEFGHDTDSYAQVMGAILGAIHGKDVFPSDMRITVNTQMKKQFGQDVNTWLKLLENY